MVIKREIFIGYCLLVFSIFLNFVYICVKDFDVVVNADAYNYWRGHIYLIQNPFDVSGNIYFGRYPEYIYDYLFSIMGVMGKIDKINTFAFATAIPTYILILYCYSTIPKVYCTKISSNKKGLLLQLLAALLPLGLTIQASRQAFAFFLALSLIIALRRTPYVRAVAPVYVLVSTHVSSMLVVILEYLTRHKRILVLAIFVLVMLIALPTIVNQLTHLKDFKLLRIDEFKSFDRYYLISIFSILFLAGKSTLTNGRLIVLLLVSILILVCTPNAIISRMFFGYSWLWLILFAWSSFEIREWTHLRFKVKFLALVLLLGKSAYIFSESGSFS